jgi:hypothetical protein
MVNANLIEGIVNNLLLNAERDDFRGYDPFDHLNSELFQKLPFSGNRLLRLAWIQLGKRSPINLRLLTKVSKKRNPKGVGLFILGLINLYHYSTNEKYLVQAEELGDWLLSQSCDQLIWKYPCWGYHFDWEAKAFSVPKGKPNIITTLYVSKALYELGKVTGNSKYTSTALNSAKFMYDTLYQEDEQGIYFAYIPAEKAVVFNASLWGAAWCVKAGAELNEPKIINAGIKAARYVIDQQKDDGSWIYGLEPHHSFIDGFHSAYNIEALHIINESIPDEKISISIERGFNYFRDIFLLNDGKVKYYHNNLYPEDTHNYAQAIIILIKLGQIKSRETENIVKYMTTNLYSRTRGRFVYQRYKYYENWVNYIRWTQGWAFYSLTEYLLTLKNE